MGTDVVCWSVKGIGRSVVGSKEPTTPVSGDLESAGVVPARARLDSMGAEVAQTQSVYGVVNSSEEGKTSVNG